MSSLPGIKFKLIKFNQLAELPKNIKKLSWDQKYLYRICFGMINRNVSEDPPNIEPGPDRIAIEYPLEFNFDDFYRN